MTYFLLGCLTGGLAGIVAMAALNIAREGDREYERWPGRGFTMSDAMWERRR